MLLHSGYASCVLSFMFLPLIVHRQTLQVRFSEVMAEKAELVQSLHTMEHQLVQLEVETDTIGEFFFQIENCILVEMVV